LQSSLLEKDLSHDPARGLDLRRVYAAFDRKLPKDRVVVTDAGRSLGTLPSLVNARDARSWLIGRGYASIGQGLGIAIGAAAANPDRLTVLFCGDGGFMMASHDLDAIRLNRLNVAIVIMNDQMYGSDARHLAKYGLPLDIISQPLPDIPMLAAAFGGQGFVIRAEEEIVELAIPQGLTLIDVRIDPEVSARDAYG
jgi:thiamine pyrophosphate-dependent acetolactate synthase large subunit-like protein